MDAPPSTVLPPLQPVRRQTNLADQVAASLEALISDGHVAPGEKLPPERVLCEQFGVSRTALREAVRSLAAKGLVEGRAGGGTRVRRPTTASVQGLLGLVVRNGTEGLTWAHLVEVRRVLEVEIAALAAARRTPEDVAAVRAALAAMQQTASEAEAWSQADVRFHDALAQATHNPLMPVILRAVGDVLLDARRAAARLPEVPALAEAHHRRILEAVAHGDAGAARRAMRDHLRQAERTLARAQRLTASLHRPAPDA
ncbi:MAG: FadR/GntR family transcriptional regulator [Chloroflexota bacterium]